MGVGKHEHCFKCPDRAVGCHSCCEKYELQVNEVKQRKVDAFNSEMTDTNLYIIGAINRVRKSVGKGPSRNTFK